MKFNSLIFTKIALLAAMLPLLAAAQPASYNTQTSTNKKAKRHYENGIIFDNRGDLEKAVEAFADAIKEDPIFVEAHFEWATAQGKLGNFAKAEEGFERGIALAPDYLPNAMLSAAMAEWELNKFDEAAAHAEQFLTKNQPNPKMARLARRLAENARFAAVAVKNPVNFEPQPLGEAVNSPADEYLPSLTADGETLVFTRLDGGYDENFYLSEKKQDGSWQPARPLNEVNTPDNEGAEAISADGTWLVFTACNRQGDGSQGSCDLYWSQQKKTGWTKPSPFSATLNSKFWDAQPCISADGKSLIFSSERPGGQGGKDLWTAQRTTDGKWTQPKNLGEKVNSLDNEQCPFLHPDGQTLYFTSNGHPGMGDNDLYFSRRQADGSWGTPENLGYPINTKDKEGTMVVSLDGRRAFFAAKRAGRSSDLFVFDLPQSARPRPVTYVKAKVRDAATRQSIIAHVEFVDLASGETFAESNTKSDGTFLTCLPLGKNYALNVSKKKYLFATENFSLAGDSLDFSKPFLLEIFLEPIENQTPAADSTNRPTDQPTVGKPVVLNNVFFASGKSELLPESAIELNRLADLLSENPTLRIQINGHTDSDGDDVSNQKLSEARAKSVFDFLILKKIDAARLRFRGFGETKPIAANDLPEGKAKNRRTEFEVW